MALGAVLGAGVEAGSGGDGTASAGYALEAASTLRTRRASGSNVRADTRGTGSSVAHAGRSRSVAARRIRRRRPSGKATAMKRGPRAQRRDRTVRRWPTRRCRRSVTVTAEIRRSAAGAARRVEFGAANRGAPRPAHPPCPHPRDERRELPAESGVKRNIPGRCGNALPVNRTPGWRDVGWDASDLGGEGTAGGPQGRGPEPAGDCGAARPGCLDDQPRAAPQRATQRRLPAGPRRGLLPRTPAAPGHSRA